MTDHLFEVPKDEKPKTPAQEIFDVFDEEFGIVRTPNERGRRNAAIKQLLEAGATPDEVRTAVAFCRRNFTSFSEMAVCSWFSRSLHEAKAGTGVAKDTFLRLLEPKQ